MGCQPLAELQWEPSTNALASNRWRYRDGAEIGSNNWSVAGSLTANGAGMVANDMHLGLSVPNIWYRASWYLPGDGRRITGVTLPGAPTLVVGSNEHIAWGFTNAYGDFHDSIVLQTRADNNEYLSAEGWKAFITETETVAVKGEAAVEEDAAAVGPALLLGDPGDEGHAGHPAGMAFSVDCER